MKKLLFLTLALVIGFTAVSQIATMPKELFYKSKTVEVQKPISDVTNFSAPVNLTVRSVAISPFETAIGYSFYDLWTNSALSNKFYRYDDGTMAATWTRGMEATAFPDRGTGYNVYDGSEWGAPPDARIENTRTGWGNYAPLGLNGEIVVAHNGVNLEISKRDTRFTGPWVESSYAGPTGSQPTWPKVIASGDENQYTHIFYHSYLEYGGMPGAILYTRTSDGGETWDPQDVILEGMGPDDYFEFQSEEFVLASKGDIVAMFVCGMWTDMFIMKSMDNGDTWEKIMIRESPYPFFDYTTTIADTMFSCDNSGSIAIDNEGKCHVVFGLSRIMHLAVGNTYNLFPWVDGIGYWNENMPPFSNDLSALAGPQYEYPTSEMIEDYNYIGYTQDYNEDGEITFITTSDGFPLTYPSIGLSTMPTITIDENDQVFVAFSSYTEVFNNTVYNFHKIWARAYAGGVWGDFYHVTDDIIHVFEESVWPCFTKNSDGGDVHMIYNSDPSPGWALETPDPHQLEYVQNTIWHSEIPKTDLLTGISDHNLISDASVSQNYPNPFDGKTLITVNLKKAATLSMTVNNILGQQVADFDKGNVQAGTYHFEVDGSDLKDGVYFYTVKANDSKVTKKMIVN